MTLNKLTRNELTEDEVRMVCEKVLDEADMDNDGRLSLEDFQHMIVRAPDFLRLKTNNNFTIQRSSAFLLIITSTSLPLTANQTRFLSIFLFTAPST